MDLEQMNSRSAMLPAAYIVGSPNNVLYEQKVYVVLWEVGLLSFKKWFER